MKTGLFILSIFISAVVFAQKDTIRLRELQKNQRSIVTDRPPQAVYFQFGGSGPLLSVNYDRRFGKKVNGAGFTAGLGFFKVDQVSIFSIPVSLNYLLGKRSSFLEIAAGTTFITATAFNFYDENERSSGSGFVHHVNLGYRYQPYNGGFFVRGGISPLFAREVFVTSYYLGFGHNF